MRHTYNEITKTLKRELTYKLVDFKEIWASDVLEILAKTKWPMGSNAVKFVWDGPKSPYYLTREAMRQQAVEWGLNVEANTSRATRDCSLW